MRKPKLTVLVVAGVTAAAIGLTVTAAQASSRGPRPAASGTGTWSVSDPNAETVVDNHGPAVVTDPRTGARIRCSTVVNSITNKDGMGLTGTLFSFRRQTYEGCTLPDGTSITLAPGPTTWTMTGGAFDPSRNLGMTSGRVHHVSLSFASSSCSGVLDGTTAGANDGGLAYQFYNNPHWLSIRAGHSHLHAYDVSGCSGIFSNGDPVTLHVTLQTLSLVISSP